MPFTTLILSTVALAWTEETDDYRYAGPGDVDAPAFTFLDIASTGQVLTDASSCDDCATSLEPFIGDDAAVVGADAPTGTTISIGTNGHLLGGGSYGLYIDLDPADDPADLVYARRFGDVLVIQWEDVSYWPGPDSGVARLQLHWDLTTGSMAYLFDDLQNDGGEQYTVEYASAPVGDTSDDRFQSGDTMCLVPAGVDACTLATPPATFVEATVAATGGFASAIDPGGPVGLQPDTIAANLEEDASGAPGCSKQTVAGTWVRGRSPRVDGLTDTEGPVAGASLLALEVDGTPFSASLAPYGGLEGVGDDGRTFRERFARMSTTRSIWYGVIHTCDED